MKTLYLDEKANLELEGNVIGSMILDKKFFIQAQDKGLQPSDFTIFGLNEKLLLPIILVVFFLRTSRTGTVLMLMPIIFNKNIILFK